LQQLHDQVRRAIDEHVGVERFGNVRAVHARERLGLTLEALEHLARALRAHHLERHLPRQTLVIRDVHEAHAAFAEQASDAVFAVDELTRREHVSPADTAS